jgi:hypothetical protein
VSTKSGFYVNWFQVISIKSEAFKKVVIFYEADMLFAGLKFHRYGETATSIDAQKSWLPEELWNGSDDQKWTNIRLTLKSEHLDLLLLS